MLGYGDDRCVRYASFRRITRYFCDRAWPYRALKILQTVARRDFSFHDGKIQPNSKPMKNESVCVRGRRANWKEKSMSHWSRWFQTKAKNAVN